ncbi:MAG: hypothetical protein WKH64_03190 [Chloroflexia bacterium]
MAARAVVEDEIEARLGYPMFVKPANMGSSVGITKVHGAASFGGAGGRGVRPEAIVELGLAARELECGCLATTTRKRRRWGR